MTSFEIVALVSSGVCGSVALAAMFVPRYTKERLYRWPHSISGEMPAEAIGGSGIRLIPEAFSPDGDSGRGFKFNTLRCSVRPVTQSHSLTEVRFVLINLCQSPAVFDDLHVKVYERQVIRPLLATIDYYGHVRLRADNTIAKTVSHVTLGPGDGAEMTLVVSAKRFEGVRANGEKAGGLMVVFGVLLDFYIPVDEGSIQRVTIPSDCVYLLEHDAKGFPTISAWNEGRLTQLDHESERPEKFKNLRRHWKDHRAFDLIANA